MRLGMNAQIGGKWQWVELNKQEAEEAMKELLKNNINQAENCMKKIDNGKIPAEIGKLIIEKQLTTSYTLLKNRLDKKIAGMRDKKMISHFVKSCHGSPKRDDKKKER